jgi:Leucine-rich repeat (LRR) protein
MRNTSIKVFPESISRLGELEALDLGENGIESVPPAIAGLKRLKRLNLKQNKITRLDEAIGECGELEELNLSDNKELQGLPDSIGKLKKLQVMDLNGCKTLSFLPDVFQNLTHLNKLKFGAVMWAGKIVTIPESLYECRSLRELQIFGIPITTIDNKVSNFVNLESLDLRGTGIVSLPAEIGSLKKLRKLELPELTEPLPESISELVELEELHVSFKGVEHPFPKSIGGLKSLRKLDVDAKGVKTLPGGFGQLQSLNRMWLKGFDFGSMPPQICEMKWLLSLHMRECNINEIPLENLTLHSLKFLDLTRNPISESSTWKKKLKACLPGTSITMG